MTTVQAVAAGLGLGAIATAGLGAVAIISRVSTTPAALRAPQPPAIPWGAIGSMVLLAVLAVALFWIWVGAD